MGETLRTIDAVSHEAKKAERITCPECGSTNPGYARYCTQCGARLPEIAETPGDSVDSMRVESEFVPTGFVEFGKSPGTEKLGEIESIDEEGVSESVESKEIGLDEIRVVDVPIDDSLSKELETIGDIEGKGPRDFIEEKPIEGIGEGPYEAVEPSDAAVGPHDSSVGESEVDLSKPKSRKLLWLIPVAVVAIIGAIGVALFWNPNRVTVPSGATDYVGQSADVVLKEFTDLGFTDIQVIETPNRSDSVAGSVMRISIKGDAEFLAGESFPLEDRVVITRYEGAYSGSPTSLTDSVSTDSVSGESQEASEPSASEPTVPVSNAGATGDDDGLQYVVEPDGNVTITKYTGSDSMVTISSEMDGHPVTKIGDAAFEGCTTMTSLIIWPDITDLGASAFRGCTSLTSISLPSSLTVIKDNTFEGCTALSSAIIWGDITSWGVSCFKDCTALTSISIKNSTDRIGDSAFQGCTALGSVIFWGGKVIGKSAFQGCTALTDISIPRDTTSIESKAFEGCTNLKSVIVWPDDDEITIAPDAFDNCPNVNVQL